MIDKDKTNPRCLWYFVGIIVTDGSLSVDKRHIYITSKDEDLLIDLKNSLGLNNKIGKKARGYSNKKVYSTLQVGDVAFYKFLMNIGLTNNKSLTLGKLNIPEQYFVDFLRGVIDGDGSIRSWFHSTNGLSQWSVSIVSAAPVFARWLKIKIEKVFHVHGRIHVAKSEGKNPLYLIKFGKFAAKIILKEVYYPGCLALERKLKKSQECLQSIDLHRGYGNIVGSQKARMA